MRAGVSIVIGATGWLKDSPLIEKIGRESTSAYCGQRIFPLNTYYRIVAEAASFFNQFDEYDVWGTELHHHNKADSSGTAKKLEEILLARSSERQRLWIID